jgi:transposase
VPSNPGRRTLSGHAAKLSNTCKRGSRAAYAAPAGDFDAPAFNGETMRFLEYRQGLLGASWQPEVGPPKPPTRPLRLSGSLTEEVEPPLRVRLRYATLAEAATTKTRPVGQLHNSGSKLPRHRLMVSGPASSRRRLLVRPDREDGLVSEQRGEAVAQNFLPCDRDQPMLLPPDLRDWLDADHLAWFVVDAVKELDLEPFYASYRADGHGAAAHEPQMMVTLFAYAYAVGERSSRGIERRCREDIAFRVICANQAPDHATIARFRVRHEEALAGLFGQVLGLCAKAGIVDVSVVAVEITTKGGDFEELDPMITAAERELAGAGVEESPGVVLADAGYWSNDHIDSLRERGMTPLVAADTTRNRPRKNRLGGPYDFMRRVMATEAGAALYSKRQCMVEPVFAQIKANRRIDRFKRRGRAAARSEWRLIAATHNLLKLHRSQLAPATA